MLVLSRRVGERIVIGEAIEVVVCALRPGVVKLGILAPSDIAIRRDELDGCPPPPCAPVVTAADQG